MRFNSLKVTALMLLLSGSSLAASALAADVVPTDAPGAEAGQAREFGMFLGGAASQYDLCVRRGFAPESKPSAEEMAENFLKSISEHNHDPEGVAKAREGWRVIKQQVAEHAAEYDRQRCDAVVATWNRLLPIVSRATK